MNENQNKPFTHFSSQINFKCTLFWKTLCRSDAKLQEHDFVFLDCINYTLHNLVQAFRRWLLAIFTRPCYSLTFFFLFALVVEKLGLFLWITHHWVFLARSLNMSRWFKFCSSRPLKLIICLHFFQGARFEQSLWFSFNNKLQKLPTSVVQHSQCEQTEKETGFYHGSRGNYGILIYTKFKCSRFKCKYMCMPVVCTNMQS